MARIAREITRFNSKKDIDQLFKVARRVIEHPGLHILIAPKQKEFGRILIIIPRKVGSAPERNKIRRRIKSIFYEEKLYERGSDCIAIIKPEGSKITFEELKKLMIEAVSKK